MTVAGDGMLAVITARGGSKGLPRKNVLPLAGKPLIAWTVEAALRAACVGRVIVSTDDDEIAAAALAAGAEVPFRRPSDLSGDAATSTDVLAHAIGHCPGHAHVALLQPTSPLRGAADIDAAFALMQGRGAPSCVSVCEVSESPWLMFTTDAGGRLELLLPEPEQGLRRQDLPHVYRLNGAVYLAETTWFLQGGRLVGPGTIGHVMPPERSVDIDTAEDFDLAGRLLTGGRG